MVLVGLGSNRGHSCEVVVAAMRELRAFALPGAAAQYRCSRLYRTSPVDCPPGSGAFINAAVSFQPRPQLTPDDLLKGLKQLEVDHGREPNPTRNAPRALDLDLLLFGCHVRHEPDFNLPHPRAAERLFVLAPANEVAPDAQWPELNQSTAQLLAALASDEVVEVIADAPVI